MNVIFGIVDQCDTKIDLVMYSQVSDLHFVVQMILPYVLKVCVIDLYYFDTLMMAPAGGIPALRALALVRTIIT